jgi:glycosyltransferase involved in cell wall biosynthesis
MVTVSCSGKLHAFALAEQLDNNKMLDSFFTTFAFQKNKIFRKLVDRKDKESINISKIHTNISLAVLIKTNQTNVHIWNDIFDRWVSSKIGDREGKFFIGWSGMSLYSIRQAKQMGMITILERGSSHIMTQNKILKEEYQTNYNKKFSIHPRVIEKELKEYEEADFISIPSGFVKRSFIAEGVSENKLFINPYGASKFFDKSQNFLINNKKFTIAYLGTLSARKGLLYLFQALQLLEMSENEFEVLFIGGIQDEIKPMLKKYLKKNWKFLGHINHYKLSAILSNCDIAVQPSLEEGLSMVIPQLMSCGIPVIATTNTGGDDIIQDGINGFIIPIKDPFIIKKHISSLFYDRQLLSDFKRNAKETIINGFTWNDYGNRYCKFLKSLLY